MKRALEQNKPTWRYAKAILKTWAKKGIHTVEQADTEEVAFRNRKRKSSINAKVSGEVVPEWFRKRKQEKEQAKQTSDSVQSDPVEEAWEKEEFDRLLAEFTGKVPST